MKFHLARGGQQLGIFAEAEVQSGLVSGRFLPDDLFWAEGMADWQPLSTRFAALATTQPAAPFNPYASPQAAITSFPGRVASGYDLASRGVRLGAAVLDKLVLLGIPFVPLIAGIIFVGEAEEAAQQTGGTADLPMAGIICFILAILIFLGIAIYNMVLLTTRGQTIAKKWLGLRIVTHAEGYNPGFVKAFLLRSFVNTIIGNVVPFYGIVDVCMIFREDKRCVHDLIADTVVVVDKPRT